MCCSCFVTYKLFLSKDDLTLAKLSFIIFILSMYAHMKEFLLMIVVWY